MDEGAGTGRQPGRWLAAFLLLVGGCGTAGEVIGAGSGEGSSELRDGVIESAAGPAGTELPDGFAVAEGTTLVGDPIPIGVAGSLNGQPVLDEGWQATFTVHGDAEAVMDAYLRQAVDLGLERVPVTEPTERESEDYFSQNGRYGLCAPVRTVTRCYATARSPEGHSPRTVQLSLARGSPGDQPLSHLRLDYLTTQGSGSASGRSAFGDTRAMIPGPPATWPPLPETGASFGVEVPVLGNLVVEPGSKLAAAPVLTESLGSSALLQVTGDPAAVLDAYRKQLVVTVGEASEPQRLEIGGATLTTVFAAQAGGDHYELKLVERPGQSTWLSVQGSHD